MIPSMLLTLHGWVLELHRDWVTALPTITPFYAIKCNNDPALLKTLAALGTAWVRLCK